MATMNAARELKQAWLNLLAAEPTGVGVTHLGSAADRASLRGTGDGWALKINTRREAARPLPSEIDGVPVVIEHVGEVVPADSE